MPPVVALLVFALMVFVLLWYEHRASSDVSLASWIPTTWLLIAPSKAVGFWFGGAGDSNESGSSLDRMALVALGVGGALVISRRRSDWGRVLRGHGWLLLLLAYMLVSILWSDIAAIAFKRWSREVIAVIMALAISTEVDPPLALRSVLRRAVYVLIPASLMLIKYFPHLGVEYGRWSGALMWTGVAAQKNGLGRICLVAIFFLLWEVVARWRAASLTRDRLRWCDALVLAMALFLLRGAENAYSATSVATLGVGVGVLLLLSKWHLNERRLSSVLPVAVVSLFLFGVSTPFLGGSVIGSVSGTLGRESTLTGRTEVWAALVPVAAQHPILGSGFGSFWTTARRDQFEISHGHNGYLDTLLDLGGVGLFLFLAWLVSCARRFAVAYAGTREWSVMAICQLVMMLVYYNTEAGLSSLTSLMTAVVLLTSFAVAGPLGATVGPKRVLKVGAVRSAGGSKVGGI